MRITPFVCSLQLSMLAAFFSSATHSQADEAVPYKMPERGICAHRGASDTHPENTLVAFREAIILGTQMIEFDVALTKDKRLVLLHDATLDRTTDGNGPVSEITFDDARKLDAGSWKDKKFKGERIPTLTEALAMMPQNIWLNVHLKGGAELAKKNRCGHFQCGATSSVFPGMRT